jgi:hypothetical protein
MANPQIGPFDKVSFSQNAAISLAPDGGVIVTTGTDTTTGAVYLLGFDGALKVNGVALGGGSGPAPEVTKAYVDAADQALSSRIQTLEDAPSGGSVTVPAWTTATLLNGVRNHPETPNAKNEYAAFRKVGHRVELTGLLQVDSTMRAGEGFVLFNLPAACRPALYQKLLPVALTNGCGTLKVKPNGDVILLSGQTDSYLSLHGVSFTLD